MSKKTQKRPKVFTTHEQPIIISGGSVTVAFDDDETPHYVEQASGRYRGQNLRIMSVSVQIGSTARPCHGVPNNGKCTIVVQGRHPNNGDDSPVRVVGLPGAVEINLSDEHYDKVSGSAIRKRHHSKERRIESLIIVDDNTGESHDCSHLLPANRKCQIQVVDDHIPH